MRRGADAEVRSNEGTGNGHSLGSRIGRSTGKGAPDAINSGAVAAPVTRNGRGDGRRGPGTGDWLGNVAAGTGGDWAEHGVGRAQKSSKAVLRMNRQADRPITPTSSTSFAAVQ
jgi:hypothetical protein